LEKIMSLARHHLPHLHTPVSCIGLGTVKWGRNQQVKYPAFELPTDATLHALLDLAAAAGLNLLDTAPAYGIAEERVGQILQQRGGADFVVMTKTGETFQDGESIFDFSAEATCASVRRSLKRLKRDHLDLVMVHCSADDVSVLRDTPVLETLEQLRSEGVVGSIGVSTMTVEGGLLATELVDAVMVPYNIGYRAHLPVIERAKLLGKGVLLKRALYSGPAQGSALTPGEMLRPLLATEGVTSIIVGTINPEHLRDNLEAGM
jgi:aryl-alcohol dehydrogenase-like predicted oxidoreductase